VASHGVRRADKTELNVLATTLARAFDDDPLTMWLFPNGSARRRNLPAFFRSLLRAALPSGEVYTAADGRAVAIWNPPGTFPMGWYTDAKLGLTTARLIRLRVLLCAHGLLYVQSHHPKAPHWYLQMLGTEPSSQGHGMGSAVIAPILDRCDRTGERIYLESSKESNIPFYVRHGFEVTEDVQVPRGPVLWAMWREPR
jgi:GNAT superfamily N-acetyltransferase